MYETLAFFITHFNKDFECITMLRDLSKQVDFVKMLAHMLVVDLPTKDRFSVNISLRLISNHYHSHTY